MGSNSSSNWTKVASQTIKFGQIAKALADVDNLVSHMQDRLSLNIKSKYERTKISFGDVLEKKLRINSIESNEIVNILEANEYLSKI